MASQAKSKKKVKKNNKVTALYIHIPFCNKICFYCDFPKDIYDYTRATDYLRALNQEFSYRVQVPLEDIKTIYIGGGTPTSLTPLQLKKLFEIIKAYVVMDNVEEFTVEANPDSLTEEKVDLFKEYGVNRVSLGVESTDNNILKSINRSHTYGDVVKAVNLLKRKGIKNISMDLILDLPDVSEAMIRKDIASIIAFRPKNISVYSLEVHENTVFGKRGVKEVDPDTSYAHYKIVDELLSKEGYVHYEVSNWAQPGFESRHNLVYWNNEKYYGFGVGAAGYIRNFRYKNTSDIARYMNGKFEAEKERLSKHDRMVYEVMMRLRTRYGIVDEDFKALYGFSFIDRYKDKLTSFIDNGYLTIKDGVVRPTFDGMMALNYMLFKILEEDM
ncbi:MAG: radical SAM family heme chaperone HemW [Coprobacillus sp.]|nr:radical SAM family heme chaperone HemW [Coprobacillus sp.]